ncbi:conserved hypothetical protein [Ricinus communis]|uniref:Uncharacterized protein n=1 Tax=Ricinus communis TaxID=3988 RepID=B9RS32_RICCO|nr:conserved hypothetical protein [Ricinus communis]
MGGGGGDGGMDCGGGGVGSCVYEYQCECWPTIASETASRDESAVERAWAHGS